MTQGRGVNDGVGSVGTEESTRERPDSLCKPDLYIRTIPKPTNDTVTTNTLSVTEINYPTIVV